MRSVFLLTSMVLTLSLAVHAQTDTPAASTKGKGLSNPDIGVNFLGLYQNGSDYSNNRAAEHYNGFQMQEAELQFSADVDAYLKAFTTIAVVQEEGETVAEAEELYVETLTLPRVTVRAGKFKLAFGRHNQLHSHAFPFIDAPEIHHDLLGHEGLNEAGVSAAVLLPAKWFSEVTVQAFSPSNEGAFGDAKSSETGGLVHFKNLWDISDETTLQLGLSGASGKNAADKLTNMGGVDLTFKWRPVVGGKSRALIWSTEYLYADRENLDSAITEIESNTLDGVATWLQYQFAERWWVQARAEQVSVRGHEDVTKQSILLGFFPSEFSGFRLQFDRKTGVSEASEDHAMALQYNISIGAHPAHAY